MDRDGLLRLLGGLRTARIDAVRAPHKPLLLLWLFGRSAGTGSSQARYADAEEPVSRLINEFGPPARPATARQRAAMPFVHLERELWDLRDGSGTEIGPHAPERRTWLLDRDAVGRLRPEVEDLLAIPANLAAAARLLLDLHFMPVLAELIRDEVDLDLDAADRPTTVVRRRRRRAGFAEEVLRAYAYQCAMCGFDGALGRNPVGLEAAHVRWHSQHGPDRLDNAVALCSLHHTLLDLGVLGLTGERLVRVSELYVARTEAGRRIEALAGVPLSVPRPAGKLVDVAFIDWHDKQVFKSPAG
ncbi:MAG TPA: HNH endonuclease [Pseudonocardiaceae bacterium]|nr:HNH endonuclease [Pseudonocardiaceae bacterium]